MSTFVRATKTQSRLRLALIGPAGSGKTYTALALAKDLGERTALIDTERGSASKYSDLWNFDVLELTSFHPQQYIDAIRDAEDAGYDVLVIDSLSHAWAGKNGVLEFVDEVKTRQQHGGSSFNAWREATPLHNSLVDAVLDSKLHVIATMRSKMAYVIEKDEKTGKNVPRKVGMQPVQREGLEYEFDVVGDMDQDNTLLISKTRLVGLRRAVIKEPGAELAATLRDWLSTGAVLSEGDGVLPRTPAELGTEQGEPTSPSHVRVSPSESTSPENGDERSGTTISEPQRKRLYAMAAEHKVPEDETRNILREITGDPLVKSTTLPARFYDEVCARIESWVPPVLTGADGEA